MGPYVLISGDFTPWGGMDRANFELARYLAEKGAAVHLVSFRVAPPLDRHPNVKWHKVKRPLNVYILGELLLNREGRRVADALNSEGARVIANGGNCVWPDVNWVHAVHAAWDNRIEDAPLLLRVKATLNKSKARRDEISALRAARVILTNSERSRSQLINKLGLDANKIFRIYYGVDPELFKPPTAEEREKARNILGLSNTRLLAIFIGALGYDRNKGIGTLVSAWKELCRAEDWDVDLAVLGQGPEVNYWRALTAENGLEGRVRIVGFSSMIRDWLHASDVLISPTHYDAYGLGVHEALCCGLPTFVTRAAGITERFTPELSELLLDVPPSPQQLVSRLRHWRCDINRYRNLVGNLGAELRRRTWSDMSREITAVINNH